MKKLGIFFLYSLVSFLSFTVGETHKSICNLQFFSFPILQASEDREQNDQSITTPLISMEVVESALNMGMDYYLKGNLNFHFNRPKTLELKRFCNCRFLIGFLSGITTAGGGQKY